MWPTWCLLLTDNPSPLCAPFLHLITGPFILHHATPKRGEQPLRKFFHSSIRTFSPYSIFCSRTLRSLTDLFFWFIVNVPVLRVFDREMRVTSSSFSLSDKSDSFFFFHSNWSHKHNHDEPVSYCTITQFPALSSLRLNSVSVMIYERIFDPWEVKLIHLINDYCFSFSSFIYFVEFKNN